MKQEAVRLQSQQSVTKTTHSRNPWRLAWHGRLLQDIGFATQREAKTACRDLLTLADFAVPGPEAWAPAIRERVAAYVATVPSVQELERVRREPRAPR
ncbi:MAG TPA: hypothetical protein VLK82_07460 [Candidatus Tectomicrobia bacterium]|nr:hypothetical protein [Candidatus Tectomicrobia bacterium]